MKHGVDKNILQIIWLQEFKDHTDMHKYALSAKI